MKNQRSIPRYCALLALVISLTAVVAGCGGSVGSGDSTTSTLTGAEYVKEANAICKTARVERKASFLKAWKSHPGAANSNTAKEELVLGVIMPPIAQMNKELGELQPPSSQAAAAKKLVASFDREIKLIQANPISLFTGEHGQFTTADELAIANGLKQCSEV
jgi:hypothetical protein